MRIDIKHIIDRLKSECRFENASSEKDSYYKLVSCSNGCNIEIRISNHKTDLNTWRNRKYSNGGKPHIRLSIVFREDNFENVVQLHTPIRKPFTMTETVYDLRQEDSHLNEQQIDSIRDTIRGIANSQKFVDPLGIAEEPVNLQTQNPSMTPQLQENKQYRNTNTIMKQKQTIKLNESQLRQMIKEGIQNVLKEGKVANNKPLYANNWMRGGRDYAERKGENKLGVMDLRHQYKDPYYIDDNGKHVALSHDVIGKHFDRNTPKEPINYDTGEPYKQKELDAKELLPLLRKWSITPLEFREFGQLKKWFNSQAADNFALTYDMWLKNPSAVFDEFGINEESWVKLPACVRMLLILFADSNKYYPQSREY